MIQRFVLIFQFRALRGITHCRFCPVSIQFFLPEYKLHDLVRDSGFFAHFLPRNSFIRVCSVLLNALDGKANAMKCRSTQRSKSKSVFNEVYRYKNPKASIFTNGSLNISHEQNG